MSSIGVTDCVARVMERSLSVTVIAHGTQIIALVFASIITT